MDDLWALFEKYQFPPQLIFNFDETMLDPGHPLVKVISRAKHPRPFVETASKGEHISLGLTVSAAGQFLQPLCILPLANLPPLSQEVLGFFAIAGHPSGFITKEIFREHVEKVVIPGVNRIRAMLGTPKAWALYLVDPHSSRDYAEAIELCEQNFIIVFCFPAHASTILQPLDLTVNKALKYALQDNFEPILKESLPDKRARLLFITVFCLQIALNALPIKKGFARAGIWPYSKGAPLSSHLVRSPLADIPPSIPFTGSNRRSIAARVLTSLNTKKGLPPTPAKRKRAIKPKPKPKPTKALPPPPSVQMLPIAYTVM